MSSVTIKNGKGYEESWFVCSDENPTSGSIRSQLIEHFGLKPEDCEGLTTHDIAVNCTKLAQSIAYVAKALGGTVIKPSAKKPDEAQQSGPTADDVFSAAERGEAVPEEAAVDPVLALIQGAATVADLKAVYASAQLAGTPITGDALDAWKARGKALKAAA